MTDPEFKIVLEAKERILKNLEGKQGLRERNPQYAFLLDLDPKLGDKLRQEQTGGRVLFATRDRLVDYVHEVAERIGGPLTAYQMFSDERYVTAWWGPRAKRPQNDHLERLIICAYGGFLDQDPSIPTYDDARFRVLARNTLGHNFSTFLGAGNLPSALALLFEGKERFQTAALAQAFNIERKALQSLREWSVEKSTGKITNRILGSIIRALLIKQGRSSATPAFDQALTQFQEKKAFGWAGPPIFWEGASVSTPIPQVPLAPKNQKKAGAPSRGEPTIEPVLTKPAQAIIEPPLPTTVTVHDVGVPILVQVEFARTIAGLEVLLSAFPALKDQLPQSLQPSPAHSELQELVDAQGSLTPMQAQDVVRLFQGLVKITERLMNTPVPLRHATLRMIDGSLVAMQQLLDASGAQEPQRYLDQFVHPQKSAGGLFGPTTR